MRYTSTSVRYVGVSLLSPTYPPPRGEIHQQLNSNWGQLPNHRIFAPDVNCNFIICKPIRLCFGLSLKWLMWIAHYYLQAHSIVYRAYLTMVDAYCTLFFASSCVSGFVYNGWREWHIITCKPIRSYVGLSLACNTSQKSVVGLGIWAFHSREEPHNCFSCYPCRSTILALFFHLKNSRLKTKHSSQLTI